MTQDKLSKILDWVIHKIGLDPYEAEAIQRVAEKHIRKLLREARIGTANVTRFEVIGDTGREMVKYNTGVWASLQDDGRTLKVFLTEAQTELRKKADDDIELMRTQRLDGTLHTAHLCKGKR